MATKYYAPDPIQSTQFIPGSATPANGGQLFFYLAGTSTKETVYKDNAGVTSWTNPIVLDSGGNLPSGGEVWFSQGITYKVVFAPSTDSDPPASPYWTKDNLVGSNDISSTVTEWIAGSAPTFVSGTSFTVVGDQTTTYTKDRRIKTTNTGGTVYSKVVGSSFGALTTVTLVNDSSSLDSGLSAVFYSIIDPVNPSIDSGVIYRASATSVAAAATTNIWGITGDYTHISGTTAIQSFSSSAYAGEQRTLIFNTTTPLVHNGTTIAIPGGLNITTSAGDRAIVRADTVSTAIITMFQLAQGGALRSPSVTAYTSGATTETYTKPSGLLFARVIVIGGGGGGGGGVNGGATSGGGGGAGTAIKWLNGYSINATTAVVIGAGGAGGASTGANGLAGSTSSFGTHCSATGGNGGNGSAGSNVAPVAGGQGSSGTLNIAGSAGAPGLAFGGNGGGSFFAGASAAPGAQAGIAGNLFGGGGSGVSSTFAGGTGAAGCVVVEEFY